VSTLHNEVYQLYAKTMHDFCQYPQLVRELARRDFSTPVHVLAIGKAAWKMAALCSRELLKKNVEHKGFVLTKYGHSFGAIPRFKIREAGHPLPDENSLKHSAEIMNWLQRLPAKQELIILLSGGGSALFELPKAGLELAQLLEAHNSLLNSGMDIVRINRERAKLSRVKQGKALELMKSRRISIYAVSDVPGNDPHVIASAPFTPKGKAEQDDAGTLFRQGFKQIHYKVIADNLSFRQLFGRALEDTGFALKQVKEFQTKELHKFEGEIKEILRKMDNPRYRMKPPLMILWGGETPLEVQGSGIGGRCSHLALALSQALSRSSNAIMFCFATDGSDGAVRSAGAYSDSQTNDELRRAKVSRFQALHNYDSYTALKAIHQVLPAPLLNSNVNDIFLLSVGYKFDFDLCKAQFRPWEQDLFL